LEILPNWSRINCQWNIDYERKKAKRHINQVRIFPAVFVTVSIKYGVRKLRIPVLSIGSVTNKYIEKDVNNREKESVSQYWKNPF
jgi:hypothetical protein